MRDKYCGLISSEDVGKELTLAGWVFRRRDHGGLIFVDLRDVTGSVQVVFSPEISKEAHEKAGDIKHEYVLRVTGEVKRRPPETENKDIPTGEVEVYIRSFEILNTCKALPFQLDEEDVNENIRLRYRYLDMRRPDVKQVFLERSKAYKITRDYLAAHGFHEFETPFLTKSTPEGARDFIVPSRLNQGMFYALPQSPQLYKQILMMGGFEKYFQIARCFRDEDLRADRQPEFTQIDIEMSFVDREDVMRLSEGLIIALYEALKGKKPPEVPFPRMSFSEAMETYGSDKPDLRFSLPIVEITDIFRSTEFGVFRKTVDEGGVIKAIVLKGKTLSRKDLDTAVDTAKEMGAGGLIWMRRDNEGLQSPIAKFLKDIEKSAMEDSLGVSAGDVVFIMADKRNKVNEIMGRFRLYIGEKYDLIDKNADKFLWVIDFPLLEYSEEEKRYVARHHPFTSPKGDIRNFDGDYESILANAYDMVFNGVELGGGSIRNHRMDAQMEMFKLTNIKEDEANEKFGFLLEALEMGAPPHGGLAFGFDRIIMMFLGLASIRDVIPFPKTQKGTCPLTGAPSKIGQRQLNELKIKSTGENR
ncbi:MAG TPA: aspartate--tRNA ligase [Syntrophorhabdaceae bacterium]|nr:aspartate--tRNA ligase [Syntrophorhabdaceae bacterium]